MKIDQLGNIYLITEEQGKIKKLYLIVKNNLIYFFKNTSTFIVGNTNILKLLNPLLDTRKNNLQ